MVFRRSFFECAMVLSDCRIALLCARLSSAKSIFVKNCNAKELVLAVRHGGCAPLKGTVVPGPIASFFRTY